MASDTAAAATRCGPPEDATIAPTPALIAGEIAWQLTAGAAIGILALIVASYRAATLARASGLLAVYVSAVVPGNARLPHRPAIRGFAEGVAWLPSTSTDRG